MCSNPHRCQPLCLRVPVAPSDPSHHSIDLRSLRSSSRRRGGSLARLSRSRAGLRLSRHRASDGDDSLYSRVIRGCISACASGSVDIRSLRSSSRRCGVSLARLSRSHAGLRLSRHCASLALLAATTAIVVALSRHSRLHLGVCLWRCRSSVASLVIATVWCVARAPLAFACWLAPLAPLRVSCVARCHDGDDSLHSLYSRLHPAVTTASQITRASLAPACRRRAPPAPSTLLRFARRYHGAASVCVSRIWISVCASSAVGLCVARRHDSVDGA